VRQLEIKVLNLSSIQETSRLLLTTVIPLIKKQINFKVAIIEMYPQIHWEPFADPLQSAQHTLGTNDLKGHEGRYKVPYYSAHKTPFFSPENVT
jgi:hypothetical protein